MRTFVYQGLPSRVVFGDGALQHLGEEIEKLGAERALRRPAWRECSPAPRW
ncbi:hypothetical protein [Pseudomonas aeruginosa]|uniref:hypothetical protein n=1 Tax=Pseudomonas aeruginosa TaxID=287 RepID=UPI002798128D|nr:hypothetical protein KK186_14325 [Pseudomonas aeruginosa]